MLRGAARRVRAMLALAAVAGALGPGCAAGGVFAPDYEYEEELYLSLDGAARLNVNASVASLVALRGAALDPDPRARVDRDDLRRFFGAPEARVSLALARRDGRRFVHASVSVDDVEGLSRLAPFAWSTYRFGQRGDVMEFHQTVGAPGGGHRSAVSWTGGERVRFRMHLPSRIVFHNAPSGDVERGNILEWEQSLSDRVAGAPIDITVRIEPTAILTSTLLLFGATVAAALGTMAGVVWWMSRRGA